MILLIDNYDSFTYNLEQMLREIKDDVLVVRNDKITIAEINALNPAGIVISPGPGHPRDAGICMELIQKFAQTKIILGVCLGMQAIAEAFGATVVSADKIVHGKSCAIFHNRRDIFATMPQPFQAGRYHSLCVEKKSMPQNLCITAETSDEQIMAIKHIKYPIYGVQFHPESILTPGGNKILQQFLTLCGQNDR